MNERARVTEAARTPPSRPNTFRDVELRGVRLRDVFRDKKGELWEVIALCDKPQATVRNVATDEREQHVIGCLNWQEKWENGPMRERSSD